MIARLIGWSIHNRFLVVLATVVIAAWGIFALARTPLDALPDLSDVQVIIRTSYPGQAPRIVENQVTYPLTTTMMSVPGAKAVRGYSFFGDSFVYVLFEDGTDLYWARSRVLEYLNQVQSRLPASAKATLGPDATGVGWIYQYAIVDRSGTQDISQLRALQDWFLRFELKTVPNVAEVATIGGMVRQYQVVLEPEKLAATMIPHTKVIEALRKSNQEAGGSVLEMGEAEYMVRASGYLQSLDDFRQIPLTTTPAGVSVRLGDVARVQLGPEMRRGIGELDGQGEAVGGVIVMRSGKNAMETIAAVKAKLQSLKASLPKGVELVPVYDRSNLIQRAVDNLSFKLLEEFAVVALVCFVFLFHMRSALPGLSASKAGELLQITDRLIKTVPEVATVYGKAGRAETATDPAPLEMFETTIQFKPREQWRAGMTTDKLVEELDRVVKVPGLANIWVPPIRNRIDMLATGIKSAVGVKVAGQDLAEIDRATGEIERALKNVPGVTSALAERLTGGRYVDVNIRRDAAARFGLTVADVQSVVTSAVGGENVGETVEGLQRFPINVRYPREVRDSLEKLRALPVVTERGSRLVLGDVADIRVTDGPPMLRSENARLSGWVYVDIRDRDLRSAVLDMQKAVAEKVKLPPGYSISWSGQFEFLERATAKLKIAVPFTLVIIFVLLYLTFKRFSDALLIMATLPFALVGGIWLLYLLGYNLSVAAAVGFIALAGVSAEFGVIMLLYLTHAWRERVDQGKHTVPDLLDAIREGAVLRVRPKAMTVAVILGGLFPIMWGSGTGSEVMQRIAAPMVGGMITAPLLSMFVLPAAYLLLHRPRDAAAARWRSMFWRRRSATA